MRCPTLADLPPPPPGKTGWPWTVESPQLPDAMPNGAAWPRISIVTPSYNQGEYIEETIRSILLQGYPNLEYLIFDGGSKDESVGVICKYERHLAHWSSRPDGGQADAVNAGLALASGEIFQFINSDDVLCADALRLVAIHFENSDCVAGCVRDFGAHVEVRRNRNLTAATLLVALHDAIDMDFHQPGVFLRLKSVRELNGYPNRFRYVFDLHMTSRYLERYPKVAYVDEILINFRLHERSKTVSEQSGFVREHSEVRTALAEALNDPSNRRTASRSAAIMAMRAGLVAWDHGHTTTMGFYRRYLAQVARHPLASLRREVVGALLRPLTRGRSRLAVPLERRSTAASAENCP